MSRPPIGDPRKLGGGLAGPGGPFDTGAVVVDTRNAVLLEHVDVAQVDNPSDGRAFIALQLEGRVNHSSDRAQVLYLFNVDGAAALVTELVGLGARSDLPWADEFSKLLRERFEAMPWERPS